VISLESFSGVNIPALAAGGGLVVLLLYALGKAIRKVALVLMTAAAVGWFWTGNDDPVVESIVDSAKHAEILARKAEAIPQVVPPDWSAAARAFMPDPVLVRNTMRETRHDLQAILPSMQWLSTDMMFGDAEHRGVTPLPYSSGGLRGYAPRYPLVVDTAAKP
jgi:hypothetical protein